MPQLYENSKAKSHVSVSDSAHHRFFGGSSGLADPVQQFRSGSRWSSGKARWDDTVGTGDTGISCTSRHFRHYLHQRTSALGAVYPLPGARLRSHRHFSLIPRITLDHPDNKLWVSLL